jgi:translation initiation factor 2B subunit (eIF-2B alpha/beta/delta family)
MNKRGLERVYRNIKEVKIQGATNIAKAAVKAYMSEPTKENKRKLMSLRPTEPTLSNALNFIDKIGGKRVITHFSKSQEKINRFVFRLIKNGMIVYTHCHSTNVSKALIYAKKKGRKFEVYNTETRPLFQGRKTAKELAKKGIKVTTFVDSALLEAIKKSNLILLGADAILKSAVINKIGSGAIAELAHSHKKPLYVVADSWKFSPKNVKIEERDFHEVWKNAPKKIKIRDPAFEKINKKYIKGIISEYGMLSFEGFVKKARKML